MTGRVRVAKLNLEGDQQSDLTVLAYFDTNKWNLRLCGVYLGPIDVFKQHYQPRLQELFQQSNPPSLDFGFGYRWNHMEANLMVAELK